MVFRNFLGNKFFFGRAPTGRKRRFSGILARFGLGHLEMGKMGPKTTKLLFPAGGDPTKKNFIPRKLRKTISDSVVTFLPIKVPPAPCFPPGPGISPTAKGPKWAQKPPNCYFPPVRVGPKKKSLPRKLRETIPDSVVTSPPPPPPNA